MSQDEKVMEGAVNLARRWSVLNEPDMLQENIMENAMEIGSKHHEYNRQYCQELASHMVHFSQLPHECKMYTDIATDLKRRDTDTTHPTQYMS